MAKVDSYAPRIAIQNRNTQININVTDVLIRVSTYNTTRMLNFLGPR